jgi:hypothetical protein
MYLLEFESGRPAVRPGQLVVLEFTPSMVIVHDPLRISPSESNKLGVILYSHNWAPYDKEYSLQRAMETGEVSAKMAYGLLKLRKIDKAGTAECMICGKHIGKKTSTEDRQRHLEGHINA